MQVSFHKRNRKNSKGLEKDLQWLEEHKLEEQDTTTRDLF